MVAHALRVAVGVVVRGGGCGPPEACAAVEEAKWPTHNVCGWEGWSRLDKCRTYWVESSDVARRDCAASPCNARTRSRCVQAAGQQGICQEIPYLLKRSLSRREHTLLVSAWRRCRRVRSAPAPGRWPPHSPATISPELLCFVCYPH